MAQPKKVVKPVGHSDITPEGRENRLISLAMDLVEARMREGTASAQEVTHFLKLGSIKSRTEVEKLELEKQLVEAKTENIRAQKEMTEMYSQAVAAMSKYRGAPDNEEDDDDYEDVY